MNSSIDEFLDEVDRWKYAAHDRLAVLTAKQRQALWARVGRKARAMGLPVIEANKQTKRRSKRARRTG
jgi:hypothetical protein